MAIKKHSGAPRVVAIGGGTGLSTMLRGLKKWTDNITAVVTVADDGGGSGILRRELGMPPPGDVRNCIQALANVEPAMERLFGYRFSNGRLKGQSLGNLFLAALNDMSGSFDEAVSRFGDVLAITGRVLPVTNADVTIVARFEDGSEVSGESSIADWKRKMNARIRRISLRPPCPPALPACIEAIRQADIVIIGPGSLYTSVIPNLLMDGLPQAVMSSRAIKVYIMNVMTQDGETEGYTASDHIRALFQHAGGQIVGYCIANDAPAPPDVAEKYAGEGAEQTALDEEKIAELGVELIRAPVADWSGGYARHDPDALADALSKLFTEKTDTKIYG